MNSSHPDSKLELSLRKAHLTDEEVFSEAFDDTNPELHRRATSHAEVCVVCRERIKFFKAIATGEDLEDGDPPKSQMDPPPPAPLTPRPSDADGPAPVPAWSGELEAGEELLAMAAESDGRPEAGGQVITFATLNARFAELAGNRERMAFVRELMNPKTRLWFRACHALVHEESGEECGQELLEVVGTLPAMQNEVAMLHVEVAHELRAQKKSFEAAAKSLDELADLLGEPRGLVTDLARELLTTPKELADIIEKSGDAGWWHGNLRSPDKEEKAAGVLVEKIGDNVGDAFVAFLTLELLPIIEAEAPSICLYPAPAMALCDRDDDFLKAEVAAIAFVERAMAKFASIGNGEVKLGAANVRWRLTPYRPGRRAGKLIGSSLGLAFGFLLRRLFAAPGETIARVKLNGVALAGTITPSGGVLPVGSLLSKILTRDFFHTLVTPVQPVDHPHVIRIPSDGGLVTDSGVRTAAPQLFSTAGNAVHVLQVEDIESSAVAIEIDAQTRWGDLDFDPPPRQKDFVGREDLKREILRFILKTDSGYGVIVGGMGAGKTTFLKVMIRVLIDSGRRPAFHLVPAQPGAACRGENLARAIYYHLRRIHLMEEPEEWAGWDITRKLGELLKVRGKENARTGNKDVILVDAANQVEMPGNRKLVPDILPAELPPGIVCIIGSRSDLGWLRDQTVVAEFFAMNVQSSGFRLWTKDWDDVECYLRAQRLNDFKPGLIEEVMGLRRRNPQAGPPVFFTVAKQLSELKGDTLTPDRKREYLTKPEFWVSPPEDLIDRQFNIVFKTVNPAGDDRADEQAAIRNTLGILAVVREPICETEIRGLGLWKPQFTDLVLKQSACFFLPRGSAAERHLKPFRFEHQGYATAIEERLGEAGKEHCHQLLAEQCLQWNDLEKDPARRHALRYALRYAPAHLRRAQMWDELYELFTDFDYLEKRIASNRPLENGAGAPTGLRRELPQRFVMRLVRDFERALVGEPRIPDNHKWRPALEALHQALEVNASVLHEEPSLLAQQLYNELAWEWGADTDLGKKMRASIANPRRMLLLRSQPPVSRSGRVPHSVLSEHGGPVRSVALSPDETTVASASDDRRVILWPVEPGDPIHVLEGHSAPVRFVAWSHNGSLLASLGEAVRIWDRGSGECLRTLPGSEGAAAIAFSPVGDTLAIAGGDGSVRLVSPHDGSQTAALRGPGTKIHCMAFSRDGHQLAVGTGDAAGDNGIAELYDTIRHAHLRTLPPLRHLVEAIAFVPDGSMVVTGSGYHKGELRFFDVETGAVARNVALQDGGIYGLAFSETDVLVTGSCDHTLGVRDLRTFDELRTEMSHADVVHSVAISRDGKLVVSGGSDHAVILWHVGKVSKRPAPPAAVSPPRNIHQGKIHAIRISRDGKFIITASVDGTARVFTIEGFPTGKVFALGGKAVNIAVFSPDGTRVAVASHTTLRIFDLATGAALELRGHESWILDLAWTPDGAHLVSVSEDTKAMVWDARTGGWLRTFQDHTARLRAVVISPDGTRVATAGDDAKVHIWELSTGQLLHTLHGHEVRIKALAWSPDGLLLASAGGDNFIKVWDSRTGHEFASLPIPTLEIWTLCFAPERFLAAGGARDGMVRIFDVIEKCQVAALPCDDAVQAIQFNGTCTEVWVAARGGANMTPNICALRIIKSATH